MTPLLALYAVTQVLEISSELCNPCLCYQMGRFPEKEVPRAGPRPLCLEVSKVPVVYESDVTARVLSSLHVLLYADGGLYQLKNLIHFWKFCEMVKPSLLNKLHKCTIKSIYQKGDNYLMPIIS